jgi:hypothetical protein
MRIRFVSGLALIAVMAVLPMRAQQKPEPAPARETASTSRRTPPIPLKVTVVLSRYQGDKRIGSRPYTLGVTATGSGTAPKTTLRMGVDVPVPNMKAGSPVGVSVSYRSVGTNIDCSASFDDGSPTTFQLSLTISDDSVHLEADPKPRGSDTTVADMPSFRNFNSSFTALLRDGQTTQYTSATDPVTGEVMKIDVTLALMK